MDPLTTDKTGTTLSTPKELCKRNAHLEIQLSTIASLVSKPIDLEKAKIHL